VFRLGIEYDIKRNNHIYLCKVNQVDLYIEERKLSGTAYILLRRYLSAAFS